MASLPGYSKVEHMDVVESTAAQLVQLAVEALKSGKKKVKLEIEVEAKKSDDGSKIELEVELTASEDGKKESRELEYEVPA